MQTRACIFVISCLVATLLTSCASPDRAQSARPAARNRVLVLVDTSALSELRKPLETYFAAVRKTRPVTFTILAADYYAMKPPAIRAVLKREFRASGGAVAGAIMVGPIPVALKGPHDNLLHPMPLYYEDFDAEWTGPRAAEGIFRTMKTDPAKNATEMWTAWWVPPSNDPKKQVAMLKAFLQKLHKYHSGQLDGRDSMVFLSSPRWHQVESGEAWTVLMRDVISPAGQKFVLYSGNREAEEHVAPAKGDTFSAAEFLDTVTMKNWQHVHFLGHGAPNGFYWMGGNAVIATRIDLGRFNQTGANIITTSGCNNGNFRGTFGLAPAYAHSIGNVLLFSPRTTTVAYFGSGTAQSTSAFACYFTQLFESLHPSRGGGIAEGYHRMRNTDHPWGTLHYMFRWADEKILCGDPFARYRTTAPKR